MRRRRTRYLRLGRRKSSKFGTFLTGKIIPSTTSRDRNEWNDDVQLTVTAATRNGRKYNVHRSWRSADPDPDPVAARRDLAKKRSGLAHALRTRETRGLSLRRDNSSALGVACVRP